LDSDLHLSFIAPLAPALLQVPVWRRESGIFVTREQEREGLILEGTLGRAFLASIIGVDPETMATHLGISPEAPIYLVTPDSQRFLRSTRQSFSPVPNIPILTEDQINALTAMIAGVIADRRVEIVKELSDGESLLTRAGRVVDSFAFGSSHNWHTFQPVLLAAKELLRPISRLLVTNSELDWWWSDAYLHAQRQISQRDDEPLSTRELFEAMAMNLGRENFSKLSDEEFTSWWVKPHNDRISDTTRGPIGSALAAKLLCHDDWMVDENEVRVWEVEAPKDAKMYEVHRSEDWVRLIERFPRSYPNPPMGEWLRWTDCSGPWLLPEWKAISKHFDSVHVSLAGYLSTSYRALPIGDQFTILSGWHPDSTSWVGRAPRIIGQEEPRIDWQFNSQNLSQLNYLPRNKSGVLYSQL
jgi:hypothetical protein